MEVPIVLLLLLVVVVLVVFLVVVVLIVFLVVVVLIVFLVVVVVVVVGMEEGAWLSHNPILVLYVSKVVSIERH